MFPANFKALALLNSEINTFIQTNMASGMVEKSKTVLAAFKPNLASFHCITKNLQSKKVKPTHLKLTLKGNSKANTSSLVRQAFAQSNEGCNNNKKWRPFWYFEHI